MMDRRVTDEDMEYLRKPGNALWVDREGSLLRGIEWGRGSSCQMVADCSDAQRAGFSADVVQRVVEERVIAFNRSL